MIRKISRFFSLIFQSDTVNLFLLNGTVCIIALLGCRSADNSNNKNDLHFSNSIDSSYFQRKTLLKGDVNTVLVYLDFLRDLKKSDSSTSKEDLIIGADSLSKSLGLFYKKGFHEILDTTYISLEKIKHSSKLAHKAFWEMGLKDSVSLKDFKEYVLPYKLTNEVFDDWRDTLYQFHKDLVLSHPNLKNVDSLYNYHISKTYYSLNSKMEMRNYFPSNENYTWLSIAQEGDCFSRDRYTIVLS